MSQIISGVFLGGSPENTVRPETAMQKVNPRRLSRSTTPLTKCRKQNWPQGVAELWCNHSAPDDSTGKCLDDPLYLFLLKQSVFVSKGFCINQPLDVPNHRREGVSSARQLPSGKSSAWEGARLCALRSHSSWQLKELLPLSWRVLCMRQHINHDKSNINSNKITGACTWLSPMETVTS